MRPCGFYDGTRMTNRPSDPDARGASTATAAAPDDPDQRVRERVLGVWASTLARVAPSFAGDPVAIIAPVLEAYVGPGRHYHHLRHIADCLDAFDPVRNTCRDPDAVALAIVFHDCVYDATRRDNEERSAEIADRVLRSAGVPEARVAAVRGLILATKHASPPTTSDGQVIVDVDLSSLAVPPAEFDANGRAIRQEFAHVSDEEFAKNRAHFFRLFLARPSLYYTDFFRRRYEQPARANLKRALEVYERSLGEQTPAAAAAPTAGG